MVSYIILYHHIWKHNNNQSEDNILDENTIKYRNRVNAVSISGLFATWLMEVLHILTMLFAFFIFNDQNLVREVAGSIQYYQYYLIPLAQVKTSAPIKRYIASQMT
jgi:hypothetical protein